MINITKITKDVSEEKLRSLVARPAFEDEGLINSVRKIINDVRQNGNKALLKYTKKFDGASLTPETMVVTQAEIDEAYAEIDKDFISAIKLSKRNISSYHRRRQLKSWFVSKDEVVLGQIVRPIPRVGIYVPGGTAAYPSTVLMNAIPPQLAGVTGIVMCTPPNKLGKINPHTLVAAAEAGVKEIIKLGGAQAIAALTYGTETITKVDKICGPGNIFVMLAKKLVIGEVGIDMLAGPSEVVILADKGANPAFIAADMLAQAEHDAQARSILITDSKDIAGAVKKQLVLQLPKLKRQEIIRESLSKQGKIFLVSSLETGVELANTIAPEHLEIVTEKPAKILEKIKNAGAIFLGPSTPEAVGDYVAGPNHTLPTSGTARFSSPLTTDDFVKRSSLISYTPEALRKVASKIATIAEAEELDAHARSAMIRVEKKSST